MRSAYYIAIGGFGQGIEIAQKISLGEIEALLNTA